MSNVVKGLWCHIQTAMVQMSVRIRAVWSWHSMFLTKYWYMYIYWFSKRAMKALIISAGWSGPALSANCIRALFMRCASFLNYFILQLILLSEKARYAVKQQQTWDSKIDPIVTKAWKIWSVSNPLHEINPIWLTLHGTSRYWLPLEE